MNSYFDILINFLLVIQFPIIHSFLLSSKGSKYLDIFIFPKEIAKDMRTTSFASVASWQLIITFYFWQYSNIVLYYPNNLIHTILSILYTFSWILLALSIKEAGMELQSGCLGWISVYSNKSPKYPKFPTSGIHKYTRHPIYLSFALILITSPSFTLDRICLAIILVIYCVIGPIFKEKRFLKFQNKEYKKYQSKTPYFLPRLSVSKRKS